MASNVTKIKTRIKSVDGAYKVTSAMKLISTIKLSSYRNKMLSFRKYANELSLAAGEIFSSVSDVTSPLMQINEKADKNLYIIVSSTLGLCGAYNSNIFKLADVNLKEEDDALILGRKGIIHYESKKFISLPGFETYSSIKDQGYIKGLVKYLISTYQEGKYREIHLIYTNYKNPITFNAVDRLILPFKNDTEEVAIKIPPLLEPNSKELIDFLIPFYINNIVYSCLLESEVSEYASRSNAMDNATKNAEELLDNLKIEFNKARQSAITQEIIEIVSASKAV